MKIKSNKKKCRKVGYSSRKEAYKALNEFGRDRGSVRVYECPYHKPKLWHLTSEEQK